MITSFIYVLLSILGLSFLIFIHELGHYWMARRVGMRVEVFSIGFGKPICTWEIDGVKWQVCWLIFGGYVKIAGTETEEGVDPYTVSDGFFGKSAWDRIKVAFMGPFVNLVFAFIAFSLLWIGGGRDKSFSEFSNKIGWMDPKSELYVKGLRPGDEVTTYDDYAFQSSKDHIYAPMIGGEEIEVQGNYVNYTTGERTPFDYVVTSYPHQDYLEKSILTTGILSPANYVIYDRLPNGEENPLPEGSPLTDTGIEYGDRIIWVDGELIFSSAQLNDVLNDGRVLLTIRRNGNVYLRRVPRVRAQELRPNPEFREELIDWQYEAGLNQTRFQDLYAIPYNLTHDGVVENVLRFIDEADQEKAFPNPPFSELDAPLKEGDQIIAVQGTPIKRSDELLREIQQKRVNVVIERDAVGEEPILWSDANAAFNQNVNMRDLAAMTGGIGTGQALQSKGNLILLPPIVPKVRGEFPMSEEAKAWLETEKLERRKAIQNIDDQEKRRYFEELLNSSENQVVLGIPNPQDRKVVYNPKPWTLFKNVSTEIGRTFQAIFSGSLSPKHVSGPIGIVYVVQKTSMVSLRETVFWLGFISLNLGVLNLLPIPMLDGGTIVFSICEMVTGRRIKPKTLEKVVVVFAVLLISFFVFVTYYDVLRVFGNILG